jgi:putative zinc finger/helix-turn-helix YgiT family protein
MKCFECGKGHIHRRKTTVRAEVRGVRLQVPGIAEECDRCDFQAVPLEHANEFGLAVDAAYRQAAGLLKKEQICAARQGLSMTQREFAEYLGVGEASVKRWELGALQDKSSDNLIRQMTDPEYARRILERLCRRLGRRSPAEPRPARSGTTTGSTASTGSRARTR